MSTENRVSFENKDAVLASLRGIEGDVQREVVKGMQESGKEIKSSLKSSLQDAAGEDQHSSPGGLPLSQTGDLKANIGAAVRKIQLGKPVTLAIFVTPNKGEKDGFHGRMLEFGTSKMPARPWFYSGIIRKYPFLKDRVIESLDKVIQYRNTLRPEYIRRKRMNATQAAAAMLMDQEFLSEMQDL